MNWVKLGILGICSWSALLAQQDGVKLNSEALEAAANGDYAKAEGLYN